MEAMRVNWTDDRLDERFDRIDERFDQVDERFDDVDERFKRVDERFKQVDHRFDRGRRSDLAGLLDVKIDAWVRQEPFDAPLSTPCSGPLVRWQRALWPL